MDNVTIYSNLNVLIRKWYLQKRLTEFRLILEEKVLRDVLRDEINDYMLDIRVQEELILDKNYFFEIDEKVRKAVKDYCSSNECKLVVIYKSGEVYKVVDQRKVNKRFNCYIFSETLKTVRAVMENVKLNEACDFVGIVLKEW